MKRAHCEIENVCPRLAVHSAAWILGVAGVWAVSSPRSVWGQSAWPNYPDNKVISVNNGRVGIGTTTPASRLDVNGGVYASAPIKLTGAPGSAYYQMNADAGYEWWNGNFTDLLGSWQVVRRKIADGTWIAPFTIHPTGNVGIGTSSPRYKLDVVGGTRVQNRTLSVLWTERGDSDFDIIQNDSSTRRAMSIHGGSAGANVLDIWAKSGSSYVPALYVRNGTGNVGIGTTVPQSKLAVNGTITAKEVIVTSAGWADYVFRPGYLLPPLSEIDAYIQAHHHLPGIPSETEVKEKGVSVGDMQAKLLAKIEEMTLHLIRAEGRNSRLQETMDDLFQRVRRLEAERK